jgi:hypothetical protein
MKQLAKDKRAASMAAKKSKISAIAHGLEDN